MRKERKLRSYHDISRDMVTGLCSEQRGLGDEG